MSDEIIEATPSEVDAITFDALDELIGEISVCVNAPECSDGSTNG